MTHPHIIRLAVILLRKLSDLLEEISPLPEKLPLILQRVRSIYLPLLLVPIKLPIRLVVYVLMLLPSPLN